MKRIFYNGRVYTGVLPLAEAFVVENDKFIFAGSNEEAKALAKEGDRLLNLDGKFVCSGFNDSHMHLISFGNVLMKARLDEHTSSLKGLLEYLKEYEKENPHSDGDWLTGRGWNQDYFADTDRMPDRYDLDRVSLTVPICVERACGHCLVVNSRALELLHVTADTPQPEGGEIGRENGEPDGRFYDNAMDLVYTALSVPDKESLKKMIRIAGKVLNSYGITSCHSDDYSTFRQIPWRVIHEVYHELEAAGELTVRVCEQNNFTSLSELKEFVDAGQRTGVGTELFRAGPLKMLGDGALGAHTAFLSRPYADAPGTCGIPVFTQKAFDEMIGYANEHQMQVAVHAIGDACLDRVLSACEKALAVHPREDHRHGIVHCQITRPDQLEKIRKLGMRVYAQSIFLDYDNHIVEQRVGSTLAATSYSWKTLMKMGVPVSNGSDCPVELPWPLAGIQCAVTRTSLRDHVGPYLPEQAFTMQEALDSYTFQGAQASFEEQIKGRIQPGMLADFVILAEDPFEVPADSIKDIVVLATYLGGRQVFCSSCMSDVSESAGCVMNEQTV